MAITFRDGINIGLPGRELRLTADGIDFTKARFPSHVINVSEATLPENSNVLRGASVTPTRSSGWISFSGTVTNTPAAVYSDYRELHTAGTAAVLGIGSFPYMDSGASCDSLFALQAISYVSTGATVTTASGAPAIGVFPIYSKVVIDAATFNSGAVAACLFASFQANTTNVQGEATSIIDAEVASGGIQNIIKFQCSAAKGATYFLNFTDDNGEPASLTNGSTLNDISATANAGWIKVLIGSTVRYIPLYAAKA